MHRVGGIRLELDPAQPQFPRPPFPRPMWQGSQPASCTLTASVLPQRTLRVGGVRAQVTMGTDPAQSKLAGKGHLRAVATGLCLSLPLECRLVFVLQCPPSVCSVLPSIHLTLFNSAFLSVPASSVPLSWPGSFQGLSIEFPLGHFRGASLGFSLSLQLSLFSH